jgi:hypothetical protein
MSDHLVRRVNPRELLVASATVKPQAAKRQTAMRGAWTRLTTLCVAGVFGLSAFGTIVVRANDDTGVLAFVRQQARPAAAPVYRPAPQAYPIAYYAPRAFFPTSQPSRRAAQPQPVQQRAVLVASYAPFAGFVPAEQLFDRAPRRKAKGSVRSVAASPAPTRVALPAPSRTSVARGGRVTYCVRTCDGFYFPIGTGSGSDSADEATCNQLCPAAETKVYTGQIGADIDEARAPSSGKRYTSLTAAFNYRKSVDKACSCTGTGMGIATDFSVFRDGSLRKGDIIMTGTGMKVFNGGNFPYREANFTAINRSDRINNDTREKLRSIEQASLPGRSGLSAPNAKRDELKDLQAATRAVEEPTTVVRYVGPDRSTLSR